MIILQVRKDLFLLYLIRYPSTVKNFIAGNSFFRREDMAPSAAIITSHSRCNSSLIIGIHLVACPRPQSNGATNTLGLRLLIFLRFLKTFLYLCENSLIKNCNFMNKANKLLWMVFFVVTLVVNGCSVSKKSNCGCPNKKGMVGY